MARSRFLLLCCFASAMAPAQETDVAQLVDQLADAATSHAARERLVGLGAIAALPLAWRLRTASDDHARACLKTLVELGPAGGAAVPTLVKVLRDRQLAAEVHLKKRCAEVHVALVATLAELIPYRIDDVEITARDRMLLRQFGSSYADGPCMRLLERERFPRGLDLDALLAVAAGRRPLDAEVAIEQLGARGPAAMYAVPLLRAVLDRPEPRILLTATRVPLHRKAAKALLAIAPHAPEASAARAALAGTWSPPAPPEPLVPERARRRIDELLGELVAADAERRRAAADNLVALGAIAAGPVAARLDPSAGARTIDDALDVLRRLGRHAARAVPAIAEALTRLPADHTVAVLRTLAATAPWSTDAFLGPSCTSCGGFLAIEGQRIAGKIDVPFLNAFQAALSELQNAIAIPFDCSPARLCALLRDPSPARRRRALEVIVARGTDCTALLETLAPMLAAPQPPETVTERVAPVGVQSSRVDRSDVIQRLAATAIVAVAPPDHELVTAARRRLARGEAK